MFYGYLMTQCSSHLDAVFKGVPRQREAFFLVDWLTENDQLLKKENPSLPGSGQDAALLLTDRERILLEQLPLCRDFSLEQHVNPVTDHNQLFFVLSTMTKLNTLLSHLKTLKPAHIHHVITAFWHKTHHLHRPLIVENQRE